MSYFNYIKWKMEGEHTPLNEAHGAEPLLFFIPAQYKDLFKRIGHPAFERKRTFNGISGSWYGTDDVFVLCYKPPTALMRGLVVPGVGGMPCIEFKASIDVLGQDLFLFY